MVKRICSRAAPFIVRMSPSKSAVRPAVSHAARRTMAGGAAVAWTGGGAITGVHGTQKGGASCAALEFGVVLRYAVSRRAKPHSGHPVERAVAALGRRQPTALGGDR